jgi:hypothetical protein
MQIQIDPKVDYAFKHVFGREESKPALVSLLDAVLQPAAGQNIASVELLNPFNDREAVDDKLSILDINARDQSGRQFNVEMQLLAYGAFRQRALYYWSRLHQGQLKKREGFPRLAAHHRRLFPRYAAFPGGRRLPLDFRAARTQASDALYGSNGGAYPGIAEIQ